MAKLTRDFQCEIETLRGAFQLSVQEDTYHSESFGNAMLLLSGTDLQVRISRDRDQFLLDLAPAGLNYRWAPIDEVFESLGIPYEEDLNAAPSKAIQILVDRRMEILAYIQTQKASWPSARRRP